MAADERWYFTKEEINNSPSRKCGVDAEKELSYRQQGAKLIQDMGQRLQVTQLVINTAIVYMHRFYMFHPFTKFHRNNIGPAALFLAAKVEEQPRKLEHVIKVAYYILHHQHASFDTQSETYLEKAQELVMNENILLQTLGFDVAIDHPHTYVVKFFQMVRSTTDLAQTSYFMATNSLHMTTMCLQYKPAVVACVCIYIVCKWTNNEFQRYTEGKDWFCHVDPTVTLESLENLTSEFLTVLDKFPNRLKKIMNSGPHGGQSSNNFGEDRSSRHSGSLAVGLRPPQSGASSNSAVRSHDISKPGMNKAITQQPTGPPKTVLSHKEYSEKKEKERREREKERERSELREKHSLLVSVPSSSSHSIPSTHPPHMSHARPQIPEVVNRKSHLDISSGGSSSNNSNTNIIMGGTSGRPLVPNSTIRGSAPNLPFKDPNLKRESISGRSEDKFEKQERTSDNVDSAKFVSEKLKSSDHNRIPHSVDWTQSRQLDRKEIKTEVKPIVKDGRIIDAREHVNKPEVYFKPNDIKSTFKSEQPAKIKVEKVDSKDIKTIHGISEVKHSENNSFIFNNPNPLSLKDYLHPSAVPPEDIFDTELDSKPQVINSEYLPGETLHHKLNSPPKQIQPVTSNQSFHAPTVSNPSSVKTNNSNLKGIETTHANVSKHINSVTSMTTQGNHSSEKTVGNGLPGIPTSLSNNSQTLQTPSSRKKEKNSPHTSVSHTSTKVKLQNLLETSNIHVKPEENKLLITKESVVPVITTGQSLLKDSQPAASIRNITTTTTAPPTFPVSEKSVPPNQNQPPLVSLKSNLPETSKADSTLSIKLPRPENCDVSLAVPTTAVQVVVSSSTAPSNPSSTDASSPLKKNKHESSRHKHKEKKKHKHKKKEKHKDKEKEPKEHKEHKKVKKDKKHKDKDKEKSKKEEKQVSKDDPGSKPLKITIQRNKVFTPEVEVSNLGRAITALPTPAAEKNGASSSSADTPGRIKLTIPKSRLQVDAPLGSRVSPPRGIPPKEGTPKVKLKIQKDHLKLEKSSSRKRDRERSPSDANHPTKLSRSSSNYSAPQVLESARWSSQRH